MPIIGRRSLVVSWLLVAPLVSTIGAEFAVAASPPAEVSPADAEFFTTRVEPILKSRCYECHSHAAKKDQGSLVLDSRGAMLVGGDSGPALVPGKPAESLLVTAVEYEEDYPRMPPKGKLPEVEVAVLVDWVRRGAPWPGASSATVARPREKITPEDRKYWAFQPPREVAPPEVSDAAWRANPVDRFIRAKLDAVGLQPSPPAEPAALVRRLYFDLIGLPPTPEEVESFVSAADGEQAYAALVDRLLADPRYGERWARHWLDLVRYAESDGFRIDDYRPHAWRYRDYVIRSLNADKPYDRFVCEQLAGDEIAPDDPEAQLATSFLRLGIYEYNNRDVRGQWSNMLNDVTDVTADVFLGLGLGCARCHDHKFDPILQRDYFALQAFLAPMQPHDDLPLATAAQRADHARREAAWRRKAADVLAELEKLESPVKDRAERGAIEKFPEDIQAVLRTPPEKRSPLDKQLGALAYRQVQYEFDRLDRNFKDPQKQQLVEVRKRLAALAADKPEPLPAAMTVRDVGRAAPPVVIPKKGTEPIEPAFLTVLGEAPPKIAPPPGLDSTGRRTALAAWLTRPDHPLTTRVIVNRVWQHHFGRGIVPSSSDFGKLGDAPSHPELLDWLAVRFVRDGWSLKKLHRLMVTSRTYRQAAGTSDGATTNAERSSLAVHRSALLVDPENRLLWRMPNRRLDAEQVRDAILAATGRLDPKAGGPAVDFSQPRRSIYCRVLRNTRDPLLDVFDAPEGFQSTADRNVTTTPTQALLMINGNLVMEQAAALAARVDAEYPSRDVAARIDGAFRLCFQRPAAPDEIAAVKAFLERQRRAIQPDDPPPPAVRLDKIPYRDGSAVVLDGAGPMRRAEVPPDPRLPTGDFTIEAFVVLRSTFENASVRTIAAHWNGDDARPGWSFGVTSRRSQFKPQMLVLQLWGADADGKPAYEPLFSSLHVQLNKPYFVAATVRLGDTGPTGVTFYAKDLSNDDEPLLSSSISHRVVEIPRDRGLFAIGGRGDRGFGGLWDGLVDDVRLSNTALGVGRLLLTAEQTATSTVGFWEFEPQAGVFRDSSPNRLDIRFGQDPTRRTVDPERQAWIDFCQVLLNANEFVYVD